ncbi:unnamed protein product [Phaedon cochleariae]|uniref:NADH dehydrogenase [ubiquinone] 1 alpha subcomplex subunit 1 n=1 Tax=Phaedon cochleariae TaxID=80249 RepID=A0A9P0DL98_PHACE|nr:unnamed protein product [Phaedon cochleariae]
MWFEIIPAFSIIAVAMAAPHGIAYVLNHLVVGNCFRRLLETRDQRLQYLRDKRLTGDPYKVAGLENILDVPDEDECDQIREEECFDFQESCEDESI